MEIHGLQNDTRLDRCRVGSNTVPTVSVNQSVLSSLTHRSMYCRTTVALFLHPYIFDRIYLKLIVTVAFLLSAASGTSASILLAHKERLRSVVKREAWVNASKHPKTFSSINFWTDMSWPLTTLTWWVIRTLCQIGNRESDHLTYRAAGLCLVAVLSLAWQSPVTPNPMSKVDVVLVGGITFLTAMIFLASCCIRNTYQTFLPIVCSMLSLRSICSCSWILAFELQL